MAKNADAKTKKGNLLPPFGCRGVPFRQGTRPAKFLQNHPRESDVDLMRIRWPFNTLLLAHWRYAREWFYDIDTMRATIN